MPLRRAAKKVRDKAGPLIQRTVALPGVVGRRARVQAQSAIRRRIPGSARAAFRLDASSMLFAGFYMGGILPFVMVIARADLGASGMVLAVITAAPFAGFLSALFWVRVMEGRLKTPFVVLGQFGARVVMMFTLFTWSAWSFAIVVGLSQMIGTIAGPAYASVVRTVYPAESRGQIMSVTRASILFARVVATLIVGWLLRLSWMKFNYIFPVVAAIGLVGPFIYSRIARLEKEQLPPEELTKPGSWWQQVKETGPIIWRNLMIFREDRAFRLFAIAVFIYGFGNLITVPIRPLIEVDDLHITKTQVSALFVCTQIVGLFAYFWWGKFVDRRSPQLGLVFSIMLNGLVLGIYLLVGTVLPASPWMLLPAYAIMGFNMAGIDLCYFSAIISFAGDRDVTPYQGLQAFLMGIRGISAPLLGGYLGNVLETAGLNVRWGIAFGMVLMLVGLALQTVLYFRSVREER